MVVWAWMGGHGCVGMDGGAWLCGHGHASKHAQRLNMLPNLNAHGWYFEACTCAQIIGVEPVNCASYAAALDAGEPVGFLHCCTRVSFLLLC